MPHPTRRTHGIDPREQPAYVLAEAARYLRLPTATLRSWVVGRDYPQGRSKTRFHPLIHPPVQRPPTLSFSNLIEAHVLRSLRTDHGVSIQAVRQALGYAEQTLGIERLLLDERIRTTAGHVFLEHYGELIALSNSGQIAMRKMFEDHLERIEWDEGQFPIRLYPFITGNGRHRQRSIVIDPRIAFGRPVVSRTGISTQAIADRIDAGETVKALAADYELAPREIEEAVVYERAS